MSYGLLVAPDIDIEIFGDLRVDAGFSLVAEWARDPAVDRVLFVNAVGAPDAGLGWELVAPMRAAPRSDTRARILHIKEALMKHKTGYRSIDVYRAVLDHGVNDVEEYDQWCRSHSSTGLINWRPVPR